MFDIEKIREQLGPPHGHRGGQRNMQERDETMLALHREGYSFSQIGLAVGLTPTGVQRALQRLKASRQAEA